MKEMIFSFFDLRQEFVQDFGKQIQGVLKD